jgi:hypothetical protein
MRARDRFCKVRKDGDGGCQTIGESFFIIFLKKIKDGKAGWQTVRDALKRLGQCYIHLISDTG